MSKDSTINLISNLPSDLRILMREANREATPKEAKDSL